MSTTDAKEEKKEAKREQKLNLSQADLNSKLLTAALHGYLADVQNLVAQGADVANAKGWRGDTALLSAARGGHTETAEWLLGHGASITERDNDGWTALLYAAASGNTITAEWLLNHGANIADRNNYGRTAIDIAREKDHEETAVFLERWQKYSEAKESHPPLFPKIFI
ncbi:MAG: ankyrin repeat domain-containing protein [Gammaproteobacteria bacterium]|nr:ankyrin repeat domain-containing protein [Gammaproteobacteria bacterium]